MATIHEEVIIIKISHLIKDGTEPAPRATPDVVAALVSVAEELLGGGVVIEAEQA
jgi:hypothetical protein